MPRALSILLLLLVLPNARAQVNNWDPTWYVTDSTLVFHDDLDYYLNGYTDNEIKQMRKQVNIWRMNFDKVIRKTIDDLRTYSEGGGMVPRTHDFELPDAETGTRYHLDAHAGKVRAFMFGSVTNPPSRMQLPRWDALLKKYDSTKVDLFVIYGKELHPADKPKFKNYPDPKSEHEKLAYAKEYAAMTDLPVLVDGLDDKVLTHYGKVPNGCYVIDADGNLIFRGTWADSKKVEHIIDALLKWYRLGRPADFDAERAVKMKG